MPTFIHSYWSPDSPRATCPPLDGDTRADVVVVGGGINGLSSALKLREAGLDVALVERGAVGAQSSTKNFGVLTTVWRYPGYSLAQRRAMSHYAESAVHSLGERLKEEGLDVDFEVRDNWKVVKNERNVQLAVKEIEELAEQGYDCSFVHPSQVKVTSAKTYGAGRIRQWTVDPAKFIAALKAMVLRAGVRIYENTPVTKLSDASSSTRVVTQRGSIAADKVVLAVNGFTDSLGVDTISHSMPIHIHALATGILPKETMDRIGTVYGSATDVASRAEGSKVFWQRLLPTGVLLFGGGAFSIPRKSDLLSPSMPYDRMRGLVAELIRRYPFLTESDIDGFWSGAITGPAQERPILAPITETGNVILVHNCFGHGMGLGVAVGSLVVGLVMPGSLRDPGAVSYLDYAAIHPSFMRSAEGWVFRLLARTPVRPLANALLPL